MSIPRASACLYRLSLLLRKDPKPSKRQQRHIVPMVPQRVYRSAMAFAVMIWCLHWAIHMSCDLPTPKTPRTPGKKSPSPWARPAQATSPDFEQAPARGPQAAAAR